MRTAKLALGVLVGLLAAFGAGWLLGSSGRAEAERAHLVAQVRGDLLDARASVLAARVDLYNVNFGDASRHFEGAKASLRSAAERSKSGATTSDPARIDSVIAQIDAAQQMAGRLDQGANARAAGAAQAIDDIVKGTGASK